MTLTREEILAKKEHWFEALEQMRDANVLTPADYSRARSDIVYWVNNQTGDHGQVF
ncbi:hypothetical protein D3C71_1941670 [compost metagenome]